MGETQHGVAPQETVNHPRHYNAHPSGVECIDVIEHMTFNLGNACKYLWRGGLKADDPTEDYRKALWYIERSYERDSSFLMSGQASLFFMETIAPFRSIFNRPSPWCEPVRRAIAMLCDLHASKTVTQRQEIYVRLRQCVQTAIDDAGCMGRSMTP